MRPKWKKALGIFSGGLLILYRAAGPGRSGFFLISARLPGGEIRRIG